MLRSIPEDITDTTKQIEWIAAEIKDGYIPQVKQVVSDCCGDGEQTKRAIGYSEFSSILPSALCTEEDAIATRERAEHNWDKHKHLFLSGWFELDSPLLQTCNYLNVHYLNVLREAHKIAQGEFKCGELDFSQIPMQPIDDRIPIGDEDVISTFCTSSQTGADAMFEGFDRNIASYGEDNGKPMYASAISAYGDLKGFVSEYTRTEFCTNRLSGIIPEHHEMLKAYQDLNHMTYALRTCVKVIHYAAQIPTE